MTRNLVFLLLVTVAAPLQAASFLKPYSAEYTVHYNGFKVGEMKQSLKQRGEGRYLLETEVYTTGLVSWFKSDHVVERSVVDYLDGQLKPQRYVYRYTGRKKDVLEKLEFDWDKQQIASLRDGKTKYLALQPGIYDKQVYQLAMRGELGSGRKHFLYTVADRGKIEEYELEVAGHEKVVTTFGEVDSVVVKKGTTTLWLAEDYNYLVVKIEQREDGNLATSYITSKSP